jgi:hypothetical protein
MFHSVPQSRTLDRFAGLCGPLAKLRAAVVQDVARGGPFLFFSCFSWKSLLKMSSTSLPAETYSRFAGLPVAFLFLSSAFGKIRVSWAETQYLRPKQHFFPCIFSCSQESGKHERWIWIPAHLRESSPTLNLL